MSVEINKTKECLIWINGKFSKQIEKSTQYSYFRIHYDKYNLFDFNAFHSEVLEFEPKKVLAFVRKIALQNIDLYNKVKMLENSNEAIISIFADNGEEWLPPAKNEDYEFPPNYHFYSNNDLAYHCGAIVDFLDREILTPKSGKTDNNSKTKKTNKPLFPLNTLEDAVKNNDALAIIYDLLIKANLIDKDTKIFIDQASGNKGHFYCTILLFFEKGYFKRKPKMIEVLSICKNTFQVGISIGTAKNRNSKVKSSINIPPFTLKD